VKIKTFLNQSAAKVLDAGVSQMAVDSIQELPKASNQTKKPQPGWMLFAREAWRNPRVMGTGWASSSRLAQTIANFVPVTDSGLIVELGSGTGVVTKALLQRGLAPERLVCIEQSASLADYLHRFFPKVRILKGDARHLCDLLGSDCQRISHIVSGLPFRSLPPAIGHDIVKQIDQALPKEGTFVQFTYDLSRQVVPLPHHFKQISYKLVWSNLPPARVDMYQRF
jgi:phosphatidylethanolamine/phosphatidyl-N-methylethanolamine N-methyltransferase